MLGKIKHRQTKQCWMSQSTSMLGISNIKINLPNRKYFQCQQEVIHVYSYSLKNREIYRECLRRMLTTVSISTGGNNLFL